MSTGPREALPLSFHTLSESGQGGGDMTRAHLEVTFKIMTFEDTGAGRLRVEGGQMGLISSFRVGPTLWGQLRGHSTRCHCFPENIAYDQVSFNDAEILSRKPEPF